MMTPADEQWAAHIASIIEEAEWSEVRQGLSMFLF